jgi:hypothetical protein
MGGVSFKHRGVTVGIVAIGGSAGLWFLLGCCHVTCNIGVSYILLIAMLLSGEWGMHFGLRGCMLFIVGLSSAICLVSYGICAHSHWGLRCMAHV